MDCRIRDLAAASDQAELAFLTSRRVELEHANLERLLLVPRSKHDPAVLKRDLLDHRRNLIADKIVEDDPPCAVFLCDPDLGALNSRRQ